MKEFKPTKRHTQVRRTAVKAIIDYQIEFGFEAAIGMLEVMRQAFIKDMQESVDRAYQKATKEGGK